MLAAHYPQPVPTLALVLQFLLLLYHQVTTLCDFFPFNGVRYYTRRERLLEAGSNFVLMALPPVGFLLHWPWGMEFGAVFYFILLAGVFATWWVPYFFGGSPKWVEIYARIQGQTITVIPRRGANPTPNLEHLILMVLVLVTAIATLNAYRAMPGANFPHGLSLVLVGIGIVISIVYQTSLAGRWKPKNASA